MKLHQPRIRLERAIDHHREFGEVWASFIEHGGGYLPVVRVDSEGEGSIAVLPAPLPDELSLELGEMLYQLRAALDSLIYEVAIRDSGGSRPPPDAEKLEFPIRTSRAQFDQAAWKLGPLTDQHREMVESIQPYEGAEDDDLRRVVGGTLKTLNDWARKDRHRGLRVVASWGANRNPQLTIPRGCSVEWLRVTPDGLLEREDEVARSRFKVGVLVWNSKEIPTSPST